MLMQRASRIYSPKSRNYSLGASTIHSYSLLNVLSGPIYIIQSAPCEDFANDVFCCKFPVVNNAGAVRPLAYL